MTPTALAAFIAEAERHRAALRALYRRVIAVVWLRRALALLTGAMAIVCFIAVDRSPWVALGVANFVVGALNAWFAVRTIYRTEVAATASATVYTQAMQGLDDILLTTRLRLDRERHTPPQQGEAQS